MILFFRLGETKDTVEGCEKEVWNALQDCNISESETKAMINACDNLTPDEQMGIGEAAVAYVNNNCNNPSGNQYGS